jgi:hypothetical protein
MFTKILDIVVYTIIGVCVIAPVAGIAYGVHMHATDTDPHDCVANANVGRVKLICSTESAFKTARNYEIVVDRHN